MERNETTSGGGDFKSQGQFMCYSWLAGHRYCPYCDRPMEGLSLTIHLLCRHPLRFTVECDRCAGRPVADRFLHPDYFRQENEAARQCADEDVPQLPMDEGENQMQAADIKKEPKLSLPPPLGDRKCAGGGSPILETIESDDDRSPTPMVIDEDEEAEVKDVDESNVADSTKSSPLPAAHQPPPSKANVSRPSSSLQLMSAAVSLPLSPAPLPPPPPAHPPLPSPSSSLLFFGHRPAPTFSPSVLRQAACFRLFKHTDFKTFRCRHFARCGQHIARACDAMLLSGHCLAGLECTFLHPMCPLELRGESHTKGSKAACIYNHMDDDETSRFSCQRCREGEEEGGAVKGDQRLC